VIIASEEFGLQEENGLRLIVATVYKNTGAEAPRRSVRLRGPEGPLYTVVHGFRGCPLSWLYYFVVVLFRGCPLSWLPSSTKCREERNVTHPTQAKSGLEWATCQKRPWVGHPRLPSGVAFGGLFLSGPPAKYARMDSPLDDLTGVQCAFPQVSATERREPGAPSFYCRVV
jgi:hypothetical protein